MPRCHHGLFQDTEYGIHGKQYDMFLVHSQFVLKKGGIFFQTRVEIQKKEITMKPFSSVIHNTAGEKGQNFYLQKLS